ncbi:MAG: hypothetical protein ABIO65_08490 [Nitrospiria bacterium]
MPDDESGLDDLLGRTRCARCGQILHGDIECPFCSLFPEPRAAQSLPKWVYVTASFLTSPLSLPFVILTPRLSRPQKVLATSGCVVWALLYWWL